MTYNDYLTACLDFAKDTVKWAALDHQFYTAASTYWEESCDNNNGGIDVSWAFHLHAADIRKDAPQHYADGILGLFQAAIDNECDVDTMQSLVDSFSR